MIREMRQEQVLDEALEEVFGQVASLGQVVVPDYLLEKVVFLYDQEHLYGSREEHIQEKLAQDEALGLNPHMPDHPFALRKGGKYMRPKKLNEQRLKPSP
ncbi:hypothetical protein MRX96_034161 [Rhipicephalus microplus]